ncbi:MAG: ABC transporter ATP-binding protein [Spirochaetales bacterium]|nr:ABC transporter ATP-binding protein [Spirochaetales bacterium]
MSSKINESQIKTKEALKFLWKYLKAGLVSIVIGILFLMTADYLQIIIYRIVGKTIDSISTENITYSLITKNAIIILLLAILMAAVRFFWRHFIIGNSRKREKQIRDDMFTKIQSLSFSFFNRTKTGDLMALLINDLNAIQRTFGFGIVIIVDIIFLGAMALISMFGIDVRLTLISIAPLPLIAFIMIFFGRLIEIKFSKVQESFSTLSAHAQESFSGIRVIKGFTQENEDSKAFYDKSQDYVNKNMDLIKIWGFFFPSINFLASLSIAIFYQFGLKDIILTKISIGEGVMFLSYLNMVVWPMIGIGFAFNMLSRGIASTKRIIILMNSKPDFEDAQSDKEITIKGEIEIKNLTFSYEENGKDVLKNINLRIPVNSSIGIMGKPGSGKTTLVSLLFHLFKIEDGKIFIDGYDINQIPLKTLRKAIGYVPQDSFLFSDTITNNIALGIDEDKIDFSKVQEFAKIACIDEDIEEFKEGYNTVVGERGITLSGGQKQRVSIARALIVNPTILILDDALSAVDAQTEKSILTHIKSQLKGRTSIIIAQRISTVKDCDQIIVLDEGKIIEHGTHEKLLENKGYYYRMYELQRLSEEIEKERI